MNKTSTPTRSMRNLSRSLGLMAATLMLAAAMTGCDPKPTADTAASPATTETATATPATPDADTHKAGTPMGPETPNRPVTNDAAVPDTTMIDGKSVPLKKTASGLRYYDTKVGTGATPKDGQTVTVNYVGTLINGTKFDASADHGGTFDFPLGQHKVIRGWDEGVATMKIGGKRRLVVPGDLAYGPNSPTPAIPADATLVFDIELLDAK